MHYGLLGKTLTHSFSQKYFSEKFESLGLTNYDYRHYELNDLEELPELLKNNPLLHGLNVTIPYKEQIIEHCTSLDPIAEKIGAVNTLVRDSKGLKGYNTDYYGFLTSLEERLTNHQVKALVLGSGGASKAVRTVLDFLKIPSQIVSRQNDFLQYAELNEEIIRDHQLIVNTTPLGTYPEVDTFPDLPYQFFGKNHLLFDLVYNPIKTAFLQQGEAQGARICNGLSMLYLQADKSWEIWHSNRD